MLMTVICQALGYVYPTPHLLGPSHLFKVLIISASQMSTQRLWEVRLPTSHSGRGVRQIPTQAESRDWPSDKQEDSRMQIPSGLRSSWWSETHVLSCPWSWLLSGVHLWVGLAWQEDNAQVDSSWLLMNLLNNCLFPHRNSSILILKSTHFSPKDSRFFRCLHEQGWGRSASFFWGGGFRKRGC